MAEDRLYAKLTLEFASSPKIAPLSDAAFRAYVETLLWSRRLLTDGFIPERMVKQLMSAEVLEELMTNDDVSPSIQLAEGGYIIHHYKEHQVTNAHIETKRQAGRKGAAVKYGKPAEPSAAGARPDVEQLCAELAELIEGNGARRPTVSELWRREARLLLDKDKVSLSDALAVLGWSQADVFWRANILSMPKFRQQYDRLKLQSEQVRKSPDESRRDAEWDAIRKRDEAERARNRKLSEELRAMTANASPPPLCKHALAIVRCLPCSRELSETSA